MSLTLLELTSYASIRSALGLSTRELSDTLLADEIFELALLEELDAVGVTVAADSDIVGDYELILDDSISITPVVTKFSRLIRLFSAYAVAYQLLTAHPNLVPTLISDSKAALKKDPLKTFELVASAYTKYRRQLQEAYAGYLDVAAPAITCPNLLGISSPTYDPVIGE